MHSSAEYYLNQLGIPRWRRRNQAGGSTKAAEVSLDERADDPLHDIARSGARQPVVEDSWDQLIADFESGQLCGRCKNGPSLLGQGSTKARWVWLINQPREQDLESKQLLSGRAAQLFVAILQALGLSQDEVYLTSINKCVNKGEHPQTAGCSTLVRRQLALIQPQQVVTLGESTAQALLRSNSQLEQLRGAVHQPRSLNCKVVTTHSLFDLLARPALKAEVWNDLCQILNSA